MPRNITVTFADGSSHTYQNAPDDVTPDQVEARASQEFGKKVSALDGGRAPVEAKPTEPQGPGMMEKIVRTARLFTPAGAAQALLTKEGRQDIIDMGAGLVRGAGSIGATVARPFESSQENTQRRADMDSALQNLTGANPQSMPYQTGKLGGEIAGTAGAGGVVGNVVGRAGTAIPYANNLARSISTAGMTTGMAPGAANFLTRVAGGAINGGVTAGMVDPSSAGAGAVIGGALPVVVQGAGAAGNFVSDKMQGGAKRLMQSSLKPTIAQLKSGDADTAVNVLLERGISPNAKGVNKLRELIDGIDTQIGNEIAGSTAQIDKQNVLGRLAGTRNTFTNQVSPTSDLAAIQAVADDFLAHPAYQGATIPIQGAQELKRGTYQTLAKKYGQMGGAETEAQKALARGLKEEIATAVPAVAKLNAEQSRLLTTLDVAERRALMELNKNPMGLAALAQSPASWGMFMADKSAAFKALAARMLNSSSGGAGSALQAIGNSAGNPVVRNALVRSLATTNEASP